MRRRSVIKVRYGTKINPLLGLKANKLNDLAAEARKQLKLNQAGLVNKKKLRELKRFFSKHDVNNLEMVGQAALMADNVELVKLLIDVGFIKKEQVFEVGLFPQGLLRDALLQGKSAIANYIKERFPYQSANRQVEWGRAAEILVSDINNGCKEVAKFCLNYIGRDIGLMLSDVLCKTQTERNNALVGFLTEIKADLSQAAFEAVQSRIDDLSRMGDLQSVQSFVVGADKSLLDKAFLHAASNCNVEMMDCLHKAGANINSVIFNLEVPAVINETTVLSSILNSSVNVQQKEAAVRFVVERGVNVNEMFGDQFGNNLKTPLSYCLNESSVNDVGANVIMFLLANGAHFNDLCKQQEVLFNVNLTGDQEFKVSLGLFVSFCNFLNKPVDSGLYSVHKFVERKTDINAMIFARVLVPDENIIFDDKLIIYGAMMKKFTELSLKSPSKTINNTAHSSVNVSSHQKEL